MERSIARNLLFFCAQMCVCSLRPDTISYKTKKIKPHFYTRNSNIILYHTHTHIYKKRWFDISTWLMCTILYVPDDVLMMVILEIYCVYVETWMKGESNEEHHIISGWPWNLWCTSGQRESTRSRSRSPQKARDVQLFIFIKIVYCSSRTLKHSYSFT